jgi:folate-dependent phosphoribosylglycinamide formyltransferase PurN
VQSDLRIVILASSAPSEIYFANHVSRRVGAVGIVIAHQEHPGGFMSKLGKALRLAAHPEKIVEMLKNRRLEKVMQQKARDVTVQDFGVDAFELCPPSSCKVVHVVGKNAVNSPKAVSAVREMQPDLIAVCGTSILKEEVLSIPPQGVLNLHGGLSQKYRGIWTTHWAVVNEEPECIGATVHYVSPGIDDGDIVLQGRPRLDGTENPESLYAKVVKLGIEMMVAAITDIRAGRVHRYPLETKGRLYLGKMMNPEILQQAWSNTDRGVIREYLADKDARDAAVVPLMRGVFSDP